MLRSKRLVATRGIVGGNGIPPGGVDRVVEVALATGVADGAGLPKVGKDIGLGSINGGLGKSRINGEELAEGQSINLGSLEGTVAGVKLGNSGTVAVGDELPHGIVGGVGDKLGVGKPELLGDGAGGSGKEEGGLREKKFMRGLFLP